MVLLDGECGFEEFVARVEPRLRRALVAAYGAEGGREAVAHALAWAWEHWERVQRMENPEGYLYRVGQTGHRRWRRSRRVVFPLVADSREVREVWVEPGLPAALGTLTEPQRVAVVLVHGFGWTLREVAELTGIRVSTVQSHVERALKKLRARMGVDADV